MRAHFSEGIERAGCAARRDLSKHEEEGEGERKRGGVGWREGRSRGKWEGERREGKEREREEAGGTSARCRLAHLPEGAYNMGIEGRRGGGKGGRVEELGRAAKARRSNHTARTYLESMQEREQREKLGRGDARLSRSTRGVRRHRGAQRPPWLATWRDYRFPIPFWFIVRGNVTGNQY